jgi:serine phosphatase RsbU (regulator of sigma subunit)
VHCLPIERGERLIVASDGIAEACDAAGAAFGETRLEALLAEPDGADAGAPALVMAALDRFRGDTPLADDASIVEIRFSDALFGDRGTAQDCDLDSVMG